VRIKRAQKRRRLGGLLRTITDQDWTGWLPIHAWLIEHPDGLILVDTGETARTREVDYFPAWHPYFRWAMETRVELNDEIGPRLRDLGVEPEDVGTVVLTHLHTDHTGGIRYFPNARFLASPNEFHRARGLLGRLRGYLPEHLPSWFSPETPAQAEGRRIGPFYPCYSITPDGRVAVIPTRGHTPYHLSVLVTTPETRFLLAGDTSYTQEALLNQRPDGVSPSAVSAKRTLRGILALASTRPMVYLPSHDPESARRLDDLEPIPGAKAAGVLLTGHTGGVMRSN
jgi:glyoxylase-like metal-dependent hydrolase (beta-lactamase superfamily II)